MAEKRGDPESDKNDAEDDAGPKVELDERADEMKAEEKNESTGDGCEHSAVLTKEGTDGAGGGAETDEDDREAGDESESRSEEAGTRQLPCAELLHADPGEHRNITGKERQNARRKKRNQPGEKRSCKRNIGHI